MYEVVCVCGVSCVMVKIEYLYCVEVYGCDYWCVVEFGFVVCVLVEVVQFVVIVIEQYVVEMYVVCCFDCMFECKYVWCLWLWYVVDV